MWQFLRDNAVWVTPVLVAIVSGVFLLFSPKGKDTSKIKKENRNVKMTASHNKNSNVYQSAGDMTIK